MVDYPGDYPGWSLDYYYISDYLRERMIGAKVVEVKGGFGNKYTGELIFDNGMSISWHEDSEGPSISVETNRKYNCIKMNWFERMFKTPKCPACKTKMKKVDWPYEPGWQCPKCDWITWENYWS